ncbi:hypothetical protein AJ87_23350 [Rhizobium yanglingense]|nr:hypothetical protein AJ87_23350 [Rhizobium yanglingense]
MILNHKDAIEFLVSAADDIGFNRYTILNLHGLLANNLLSDPSAAGRLRYIAVGIERSAFHPLEVPQLIEEFFDQILATARIATWAADRIDPADSGRFVEVTEAELTGLHEGNFARYQIRPSEFAAWRKVWEAK